MTTSLPLALLASDSLLSIICSVSLKNTTLNNSLVGLVEAYHRPHPAWQSARHKRLSHVKEAISIVATANWLWESTALQVNTRLDNQRHQKRYGWHLITSSFTLTRYCLVFEPSKSKEKWVA